MILKKLQLKRKFQIDFYVSKGIKNTIFIIGVLKGFVIFINYPAIQAIIGAVKMELVKRKLMYFVDNKTHPNL